MAKAVWALPAAVPLQQGCVQDLLLPEQPRYDWQTVSVPSTITGFIRVCASDGEGTLYAGGDYRSRLLWRSTDNGRTWLEKSAGLHPLCGVCDILIKDAETVFAAQRHGGVFLSRNRGDSWKQMNNHLTDLNVVSLAALPGGEIIAGTEAGRIFRSSNDAERWIEVESSMTELSKLIVDFTGNVYAACNNQGVHLSEDGGLTWNKSTNGPEGGISCLAIDNAGCILAGGWGLYRSAGSAQPWIRIESNPELSIYSLAVDHAGSIFARVYLFAPYWGEGLFRSHDGGISWEPAYTGLGGLTVESIHCREDVLLAATGRGVFRSTDGGDTWNPPYNYFLSDYQRYGYSSRHALSFDGRGAWYLLDDYAIYRSTDAGENWIRAWDTGREPTCMAVCSESRIVAGTHRDIRISDDAGQSWSRADTFRIDFALDMRELAVSNSGVIFGRAAERLVRSLDGGASWHMIEAPPAACMAAGANGSVYLGTHQRGVMVSRDDGLSWSQVSDSTRVYWIAADRSGNVFAACEQGIICSPDEGRSWRSFEPQPGLKEYFSSRLAVVPGGELAVIAIKSAAATTLYLSADCFSSWTALEVPFIVASMYLGPDGYLFVDAHNPRDLYRSGKPLFQ